VSAPRALGNWPLRLLALLIAFVLWLFVVGSERRQVSTTADIEYVGLRPDVVLLGDLPDRLDLQLETTRWAGRRVTREPLRVRVDVATLQEGETMVPISPADVEAPPGIRVTRIAPPWVRVTLARALERPLPVVPTVRGAPARGHVVQRVTVDPPTVTVRGPRTTIERRDRVETAPVDVSGSRRNVTQTVALLLPEFVTPTTRAHTVQVTVEIQPEARMQSRGEEP
jgi:YbbR domain-containing protein